MIRQNTKNSPKNNTKHTKNEKNKGKENKNKNENKNKKEKQYKGIIQDIHNSMWRSTIYTY